MNLKEFISKKSFLSIITLTVLFCSTFGSTIGGENGIISLIKKSSVKAEAIAQCGFDQSLTPVYVGGPIFSSPGRECIICNNFCGCFDAEAGYPQTSPSQAPYTRVTPCSADTDFRLESVDIKIRIPQGETATIFRTITNSEILAKQTELNGAVFDPIGEDSTLIGNPIGSTSPDGNNIKYTLTPDKFEAFKNGGDSFSISAKKVASGGCYGITRSSTVRISYTELKANDDEVTAYLLDNDGGFNTSLKEGSNATLDTEGNVLLNPLTNDSGISDFFIVNPNPQSAQDTKGFSASKNGSNIKVSLPKEFEEAYPNTPKEITIEYGGN